MLISEYLRLRNDLSVQTGKQTPQLDTGTGASAQPTSFEQTLQSLLEKETQSVEFSRHALDRLEQRGIDLSEGDRLERLQKAVEIAQQKGSKDSLVLMDQTAFVISVKNNTVITALAGEDFEGQGTIFTNIDSTVII